MRKRKRKTVRVKMLDSSSFDKHLQCAEDDGDYLEILEYFMRKDVVFQRKILRREDFQACIRRLGKCDNYDSVQELAIALILHTPGGKDFLRTCFLDRASRFYPGMAWTDFWNGQQKKNKQIKDLATRINEVIQIVCSFIPPDDDPEPLEDSPPASEFDRAKELRENVESNLASVDNFAEYAVSRSKNPEVQEHLNTLLDLAQDFCADISMPSPISLKRGPEMRALFEEMVGSMEGLWKLIDLEEMLYMRIRSAVLYGDEHFKEILDLELLVLSFIDLWHSILTQSDFDNLQSLFADILCFDELFEEASYFVL